MTQVEIPRIDWRQQFRELEPFLEDRGGVVRIRMSEHSAASSFSKAIRMVMDRGDRKRPWSCVQIDAENSNTHYLDDVVAQLDRSLGFGDPDPAASADIQIGTNIEAERVEISDIHVNVEEDGYSRAMRSMERLDRVARSIRARLPTERIALLFLESHRFDRAALARFRRRLWDERLRGMTEEGLLLIDISNPGREHKSGWPPDPDLLLDLPDRFDDSSYRDAHEDLVRFALADSLFTDEAAAAAFATTLLGTSETVREMYAGLGLMRASPVART